MRMTLTVCQYVEETRGLINSFRWQLPYPGYGSMMRGKNPSQTDSNKQERLDKCTAI